MFFSLLRIQSFFGLFVTAEGLYILKTLAFANTNLHCRAMLFIVFLKNDKPRNFHCEVCACSDRGRIRFALPDKAPL